MSFDADGLPIPVPACQHGYANPASCTDCMYEGNVPPARRTVLETIGQPFAARFGGSCRGCHLEIHEGQQIVRLSDDTYRHEGCKP